MARKNSPVKLHEPAEKGDVRLYTLEVFLMSGPISEKFAIGRRSCARVVPNTVPSGELLFRPLTRPTIRLTPRRRESPLSAFRVFRVCWQGFAATGPICRLSLLFMRPPEIGRVPCGRPKKRHRTLALSPLTAAPG
jgi:hypothetical protein